MTGEDITRTDPSNRGGSRLTTHGDAHTPCRDGSRRTTLDGDTSGGAGGAVLHMWAARPLSEELSAGSNNRDPVPTTRAGEDLTCGRPNGHGQQQGLDLRPQCPPPPPLSACWQCGGMHWEMFPCGPKAGYPYCYRCQTTLKRK